MARSLEARKIANYSAGLVFRPFQRTTFTLNAYQITIKSRFVEGGAISGQAAID